MHIGGVMHAFMADPATARLVWQLFREGRARVEQLEDAALELAQEGVAVQRQHPALEELQRAQALELVLRGLAQRDERRHVAGLRSQGGTRR